MATTFLDASHYQSINLDTYWSRHDRMALKVTEGTAFKDDAFRDRYRYAASRGLPLVLYHFDRAAYDGAMQFDAFLNAIKGAGGPRPQDLFCLDSEDTATPYRAAASAKRFTERGASLGYEGCVYTGVWFANPHNITAGVVHPTWRKLWLSDYNAKHEDATMPLPSGWSRSQVIARQYTDKAPVPGVAGTADYSRVITDWLSAGPILEEDVAITEAEFSRIRQELIVALADPTHQYLQDDISAQVKPVKDAVTALSDKVDALLSRPTAGPGGSVDVEALAARVDALIAARYAS